MSAPVPGEKDGKLYLESKRYQLVADGTMPVLDLDIKSGKLEKNDREKLTIEIYHPMSGEVFEARYKQGRIEVDRDGSVTYFTTSLESATFSVFLKRNVTVSIDNTGKLVIKSPSKILSVTKKPGSRKKSSAVVESDSITVQLE